MQDNQVSLTEQIRKFDAGEFTKPDTDTQIDAGWFDWFCDDEALAAKTKRLYGIVKKIVTLNAGNKFNPDRVYMFMKNNCPGRGSLYDSFSICDLRSGDVLYWITPRSGHTVDNGEAQLCGPLNDFREPLAKGKLSDIYAYF